MFRGLHHDLLPLSDIADLGRHVAVLDAATWRAQADPVEVHRSEDGTTKLVLSLHDGARIEAVLIEMQPGRLTLCVSTQVGCAMACAFCATGTLGLARPLAAGEIVAQVHAARRLLAGKDVRLTRLVFMGMGEPLHHYERTRDALQVLMDDHGRCFGSRNITVSTVGLVPGMRRLADDFRGRIQLALSLHAGTDKTRQALIPAARRYPLAALKQALEAWPLPNNRVLMLEVVVLPGINDGPDDIAGVADFARGLRAVVNLLCFNPFPGAPFTSPTPEQVLEMQRALQALGTPVTVRWPRGRESAGACGQLALLPPQGEGSAPSSEASSGTPGA